MHKHGLRRGSSRRVQHLFLSFSMIVLALAAAACFRPSGAGLEATAAALGAPTFTPIPTETPPPPPTIAPSNTQPGPPTITPSPIVVTATPTTPVLVTLDPAQFLVTEVAMLPQAQDPIILTATALAVGPQPFQPVIEDTVPDVVQPVTDPLALTATAIVSGATLTAAYPMTQTMEAILGPTLTPTSSIVVPITPPAGSTQVIVPGTDCIHVVQASDRNLFRISLAYGLTVNQIAAASGIVNPALIYIGQELRIPGCGTTGYRPPVSGGDAGAQSGGGTTSPGTNVCGPTYIVQQGETLFEISLRCGVPVMTIAQLSGVTNINLIFINQELRLQ